jgi:hypothetical protein
MCTGHDHDDDVDVLRPLRDELSTGPKGNSARLHSGLGTWHGLVTQLEKMQIQAEVVSAFKAN